MLYEYAYMYIWARIIRGASRGIFDGDGHGGGSGGFATLIYKMDETGSQDSGNLLSFFLKPDWSF